jgi:anti-sigma B factor antagonist
MDLSFEISKKDNHIVMAVTGEIDLYSVKQLKESVTQVIEQEREARIIMDLNNVKYIDSTGLGILIGIKRRCAEKAGELSLVFDSERIANLFNITGLHNVFAIYKTLDEAAAKFQ